ncbi:insulinase family protein [bacterium]|nr:insulinase family protein [bacterium]
MRTAITLLLAAVLFAGCASQKGMMGDKMMKGAVKNTKKMMDSDPVPAFTPKSKIDTSPVKLPEITEKTLANGLRVYYVPQDELPVVSFRLLVLSGGLYNPMDKPGITQFTTDLLTKGTENRSATEIADEIDFIGGSLNSGAGWNGSYVQSQVLKRDFEAGLDLLQDVTLHPTFPEEEIERARKQLLSGIMSNKDDPGTIASQEFSKFVYGDHPYAFPGEGTMESVQAFTRDDLVEQYNKLFLPNNTVLAIAGDIDVDQMHKKVESAFGAWKKGTVPTPVKDSERGPGGQILIVDKPDAVQSEIRLGYILGPYNLGEDVYAFRVMNYMFGGGGFSSRLMLKIRNELGLTYGIGSGLSSKQQAGAYTISSFTKTESTGQMVEEIFNEMRKAIAEGFTADELKDAQSFLVGQYPNNFETPSSIATQYQSALLFDFGDPAEHIAEYRRNIAAVTLDDVNRMAKKYLNPDWIRIAIVGNASEVEEQVKEFGAIEKVKLEDL